MSSGKTEIIVAAFFVLLVMMFIGWEMHVGGGNEASTTNSPLTTTTTTTETEVEMEAEDVSSFEESVKECKVVYTRLHDKVDALSQAHDRMWIDYERNCADFDVDETNINVDNENLNANSNGLACGLQVVGEPIILTHLRYVELRDTDEYTEVRRACHDLGNATAPTSLCRVDSILEVTDQDGVNRNGSGDSSEYDFTFVVRREPVCYPYGCGADQASAVEPTPLGCNPSKHTCSIRKIAADCPNQGHAQPKQETSTATCDAARAAMSSDSTYRAARDALDVVMGKACNDNAASMDDASPCSREVKPLSLQVVENYRSLETSANGRSWRRACYDAGGTTCYLSAHRRTVGKVLDVQVEIEGDYNDFPVCLPSPWSPTPSSEDASSCGFPDVGVSIATARMDARLSDRAIVALRPFLRRHRQLDDQRISPQPMPTTETTIDVDNSDCPFGMEDCSIAVADFYCTGRDGDPIDPDEPFTTSNSGEEKLSRWPYSPLGAGGYHQYHDPGYEGERAFGPSNFLILAFIVFFFSLPPLVFMVMCCMTRSDTEPWVTNNDIVPEDYPEVNGNGNSDVYHEKTHTID